MDLVPGRVRSKDTMSKLCSQADFGSLDLPLDHNAACLEDADSDVAVFSGSGTLLLSESRQGSHHNLNSDKSAVAADEALVKTPVTTIEQLAANHNLNEEVVAFITAWQRAVDEYNSRPRDSADDAAGLYTNWERQRCCVLPNAPPPKRFYRTFWKGITRRMLSAHNAALEAKKAAAGAAAGGATAPGVRSIASH